jgi:hypothetical protein
MNTKQATREERAREYIDSIIAINQKYGMGGEISDDEYEEAVAEATNAYRAPAASNAS